MALKTYKPTTPAQRQLVLVDRSGLYKGKPLKALTEGKISTGGRNNLGRITTRFRGGGHKKAYRTIDFKRARHDAPATVERIEYDPNRTGFIALIKYKDGEQAYILAPQRLAVGDTIVAGDHVDVKPGNAMPLGNIPVGSIVHNIELKPGKGGQMARSAGSSANFTAREGIYALLRLKSGESRKVHIDCRATIGEVSNDEHNLRVYGKAGAKRWLGIRPTVRGQAMNPVDHPHGGGEGKSGQGNPHPVSPWGQNAKGLKTRTNKRTSNMIVQRRQNRIR
jgi:large subunit ribosomal protein L2